MLEATFRPLYQSILVDPLVRLIGTRISPVSVTILASILGMLFIPALLFAHPTLAIFFLLASGYCDTVDGSLARFQNRTSAIGSVMDIMGDRLVEFCALFGLYLVDPQARAFPTILMLGSIFLCITSFLVVGIFTPNDSAKSFHYSPGLMERAEAFLFFMLMVVIPQYFNLFAYIFLCLVCLTAINRLRQFVKKELQ